MCVLGITVTAYQPESLDCSLGNNCRGRRGMSARLRLNAPWLENSVRQDCDISHSECVNILVYGMHVTRV